MKQFSIVIVTLLVSGVLFTNFVMAQTTTTSPTPTTVVPSGAPSTGFAPR